MGKQNERMEYYRQGMLRAYKLVKEDGIEALEKELQFRNVTRINGPMLAKEIDVGIDQIKRLTFETIQAMAAGVLYSEFGFGKKRIERFVEAFGDATDGLADGIVTWSDICCNIEDLTGFRAGLIEHLDKNTGMIRED